MSIRRCYANGTYIDSLGTPLSGFTVVGDQPVLGDESDSTYLEAIPNAGGPTVGLSSLSSFNSTDIITLHARLGIFLDGPTSEADDWRLEIFLATDSTEGSAFAGFSDGSTSGFAFHIDTTAADATIDQTVALDLSAWSPTTTDDVGAALLDGAWLQLNAFRWVDGDSEPLLRIYEAWVEVASVVTNPPPLRQFPRSDGLGAGPKRIYPPPDTRRRFGGTV